LSSLNAPISQEAERRVAEVESGKAELIEGEEAFARLHDKYRQ
jgi:hypothetical protein